MKAFLDFFPVLLFFIAYKTSGMWVATATLMVATIIQTGIIWIRNKKLESIHILTLAAVLILGSATLIFKNENYIKLKPTVIYWVLAITLLITKFIIPKKNLIEMALSKNIILTPTMWTKLHAAWMVFFVILGFLNLYIANNYSESTWVNFKFFGLMGITFVFLLLQVTYIAKVTKKDTP